MHRAVAEHHAGRAAGEHAVVVAADLGVGERAGGRHGGAARPGQAAGAAAPEAQARHRDPAGVHPAPDGADVGAAVVDDRVGGPGGGVPAGDRERRGGVTGQQEGALERDDGREPARPAGHPQRRAGLLHAERGALADQHRADQHPRAVGGPFDRPEAHQRGQVVGPRAGGEHGGGRRLRARGHLVGHRGARRAAGELRDPRVLGVDERGLPLTGRRAGGQGAARVGLRGRARHRGGVVRGERRRRQERCGGGHAHRDPGGERDPDEDREPAAEGLRPRHGRPPHRSGWPRPGPRRRSSRPCG